MRIAMIHWAFPPIIGGVESHLALLCPWNPIWPFSALFYNNRDTKWPSSPGPHPALQPRRIIRE